MVLNLTFTLLAGKTIVKQINEDIQREEFIDIVSHFIANTDAHRFIVNGKQLDLCDDENFEKQKRFLLKNGTTVYVLERMIGGGFVEMSMLIAIILGEMEQELHKLETSMDNESPCAVCKEEPVCLKLCCNRVCKECFCMYFDSCNLKLRCMVCKRQIPYEQIFKTAEFIKSLESLDEIRDLMKHIDCQICRCGTLMVNETLQAQQQCAQCHRHFCFFCNKDWNDDQMKNDQYTCHSNCDYEVKKSYELVPLKSNPHVLIPNRRCCPRCYMPGAYDEKCKYHTCVTCLYSFCFICLEEEELCKTKYQSNYQHKCTDLKEQHFKDFSTIIQH
ncbi:unnamed protein product [Didymodactylos carnosus]|uniref:RING-type domain-containing protein n=1 Tax=Didymodactylos carnosus TaxID=1234261 RepID=A0A8S2I891_9BILA|nr:unnamed protein product [Didymodactylos carnosus]CAF3729147.1 unnamed protein product [Didymodactylos carnosus]